MTCTVIRNKMGYYYLFEMNLWGKLKELAHQYGWAGNIDFNFSFDGVLIDEEILQDFLSALQRADANLPNTTTNPKMVLLSEKSPSQQMVQQAIAKWWNQKSMQVDAMGSTKPWLSFAEPTDVILCKPDDLDMQAMPPLIAMQAKLNEVGVIFLNMGVPVRDLFGGTWKAKLTNFRDFCKVGGLKVYLG
jgi:hypothetical protein